MSTDPAHNRSKFNPWWSMAALWKHRELLWQFTLRNIEMRHKGSLLGFVWSVLSPLLTFSLYLFVFGFVFAGKYGTIPNETTLQYALALFVSLAILQLVIEVTATSPLLVVSQPNFVKKVVFPLEILPVASVGASLFHFFISITLGILGVAFLGPGLSWTALWLPVIILPVVLIALGVAWFASALGVFFRDVAQLAPFLGQVLLYVSAVFYSERIIPHPVWIFLRLNPLLHAVELTRAVLVWHLSIVAVDLAYLYAFAITFFILSAGFFHKLKPAFADVL